MLLHPHLRCPHPCREADVGWRCGRETCSWLRGYGYKPGCTAQPWETSSEKTLQMAGRPDPDELSPNDRKMIRLASPCRPKGKGSGTPKSKAAVPAPVATVAPADVAAGGCLVSKPTVTPKKSLGTHKRQRSPSPSNAASRTHALSHLSSKHIWHVCVCVCVDVVLD